MEKIEFSPAFAAFLKCFNDQKVEYLLIGGYAVNLHGYIRTTDDLGVWIAMSSHNAQLILRALDAYGFDVDGMDGRVFTDERNIIRFGAEPLRIEVVTTIGGVQFEACYSRAVQTDIAGLSVPVLSLADLRINKAASGRPKDLIDLDHLPEA